MSLLLAITTGGVAYADTLSAGSYLISGKNVTDVVARSDSISTGAYVIAGKTVSDLVSRADSLSVGAYIISGKTVTDTVSRADSLSNGAYVISGKSISDLQARSDNLSPGAYVISGQDITDVKTGGGITYADDLSPGSYVISGQSISDAITHLSIDGGGGRRAYWQPYWIEKKDWEKIPAVAVQAIERVARSKKVGEDAEMALIAEMENYQARYGVMLQMLRQNHLNSLAVLKKQQLAQIQAIQDEEDEFMMMMY